MFFEQLFFIQVVYNCLLGMTNKFIDLSDEEKAEKALEMQDKIHLMETEVQKGYIGQEDVIHKILLCVCAGGNILLEGVPGLGKSFLVTMLAKVVEGAEMNRIQFTPDKLPSDIVGVEAYNEDKGFYVEKGPIFGNFILADEINRAPPKVQSAMLEAMQEHKVSIGDETFRLPEPFFTMATQNPVEQGGSLHPEETVYVNGKLQTAEETLEDAKENGELFHEDEDKRIYDAGDITNHLNLDGEMEETGCKVYEKDYEGKLYSIRTRTGRSIKVNADHPLLVNSEGKLVWKQAEELRENDFLVTPETLDLPEKRFPSHEETIDRLEEFETVTERQVENSIENIEEDDFSAKDINRLRIASQLSKKELAEETGVSYDRTLNYLNGCSNGLSKEFRNFFSSRRVEIGTYLESFKTHRIDDVWTDSDAGFFIGFSLAEGTVSENSVEVSQKNYPDLIERWIELAEKKGLKVNTRVKDGVKHAKIRSKPFVRYLEERYNVRNPEKYLEAPEEFKKQFLYGFIVPESYFENDKKEQNVRVTFTQKNREITNLISYLLVERGIRPKIYDEKRVYRIKISDNDLHKFIEEFGWRGEKPELNSKGSGYRVTTVNPEMFDELTEALGLKHSGDMKHQKWYTTYRMAKQRGRISEYSLKEFVESMRETLKKRRTENHDSLQEKARSCGIPMTCIVENTELTKNRVWQTYENGSRDLEEAEQFVERERELRLYKAEQLIHYLDKLVNSDVFYDPIQSIETEEYEGPVIGLSVPETHNYVAGLGACGINHNTYPLPEAQIDRFLFKIYLDYPKKHNEQKIIDMNANIMDDNDFDVNPVVSSEDVLEIQEFSKVVTVSDEIKAYIVDLVDASRNPEQYGLEYSDYIAWGCTPRASINLALAGRANALYNGRHYVTPEDIRAVIHDVFVHRIILNYEGEAQGLEIDEVIQNIVDRVPVR